MTKQLNLDEMLEVCKRLDLPIVGAAQFMLELCGNAMAQQIAVKLHVNHGTAKHEEAAFGGTCCPFYPSEDGQPCPEPLTDYDQDEWDEEKDGGPF